MAAFVVDEPELPSAEALPVELLEVPDELPAVEVDSPELVSLCTVVTAGVVNPVDDAPGLLHAVNNPNKTAKARWDGAWLPKLVAPSPPP